MVYKIETDISTPSGGDVFLQKSKPYATPLFGVLLSCSKSATGISKGGGVCDVLVAKNPNHVLQVDNLVGDTRKGDLCLCQTRTGSGCKTALGS